MRVCGRTRLTETDRRNHVSNRRRENSKSDSPHGLVGSNPTHFARKLSLQAVFAVCRLFLFSVLWEFFREFSPEIGSSLLKFLRFELWICILRYLDMLAVKVAGSNVIVLF